ncbi:hypothetical protein H0H92_002901 [Tricholoma furcatifolium]|nr:hypothetical protein H0H92_002901 [Tricholoma furcatifolium]
MNTSLKYQLAELQLIRSSLLSEETLTFLDEEELWTRLTAEHDADPATDPTDFEQSAASSRFRIDTEDSGVSFVVEFPKDYDGKLTLAKIRTTLAVKGDRITRDEQERWQGIIEQQLREIGDSDFPIYQLLSLYLLPLLHDELENRPPEVETIIKTGKPIDNSPYHALFTSHHLISPNKRRSLQSWSASLSLSGFAKVGYPGVIYAYGQKENVEEFVGNVKAMQWLALKVRFVEELPGTLFPRSSEVKDKNWAEFQKVGEVVEEMRRLGREQYVVEMGIGSAAKEFQ